MNRIRFSIFFIFLRHEQLNDAIAAEVNCIREAEVWVEIKVG